MTPRAPHERRDGSGAAGRRPPSHLRRGGTGSGRPPGSGAARRRSRVAPLALALAAVSAVPGLAGAQERRGEDGATAATGQEEAALLASSTAGPPALSSVPDIRVVVEPEGPDSLRIRLTWDPPAHGARPARYEAFLARVSVPHREELGRATTQASTAEFRIARRPAGLDCCPVVDGRAVYMDGAGAGAWDSYPEGPYRQLLTAGVTPLGGDGERGVLRTLRLDPEAILLGIPPAVAGEGTGAAGERPGRVPPGAQEPPAGSGQGPDAGPSGPGAFSPRILYGAIAVLAVLVLLIAFGFGRGRHR